MTPSADEELGGKDRRRRLDNVAAAFLSPQRAMLRLAVAGPDDPAAPAATARALLEETHALGLAGRLEDAPPQPSEVAPAVFIQNHGVVDEGRLSRLAAVPGVAPDVLVWTFRPSRVNPLRSIYLLGMWAWACSPGQIRCLLPPCSVPWDRLQQGLERAWSAAGITVPREVIRLPADWSEADWRIPIKQLLQGALSAPRRPLNPPPDRPSGPALGGSSRP